MPGMRVTLKPIGQLEAYERNPRKITDEAVQVVVESIQRFGWLQPIVTWHNKIVAGHTRLKAARKLGLKKVPVFVADHLTEAEARAARLTDNRSHELTGWDVDMLATEVGDMDAADLPGFEPAELQSLSGDSKPAAAQSAAHADTSIGGETTVTVTVHVPRDRIEAFREMVEKWLARPPRPRRTKQ